MIVYDRKKMGEVLRAQRVSADFTQAEAARSLGYTSPQFLSNIERGISVIPLKTLRKLINLYEGNTNTIIDLIMAGSEQDLRKALATNRRRSDR
jgi:transcriptional regulator with XRE-family HTH domain